MVHRKSTYRLMFKNYGSEIRRNVWRENNSLRLRRREEEMSHHSIEESDSDCICDESEEEEERQEHGGRGKGTSNMAQTKSILSKSEEQIQQEPSTQAGEKERPPHIPRLHFTPEPSPRASHHQITPNEFSRDGTSEQFDDRQGSMPALNLTQDTVESQNAVVEPRRKPLPSGDQVGVMRPGSCTKEYDLIPAVSEDINIPTRGAPSSKSRLMKSHKYPLTTQLSRTTQRNFQERDKISYVPFGTGAPVKTIGDKTSFNIHLNKNQVRPTALQASSLRNREIERLMKPKKIAPNDWRGKRELGQPINHSSLWADAKKQTYSRSKTREKLLSVPNRVEVFSNYCKHCGGRR